MYTTAFAGHITFIAIAFAEWEGSESTSCLFWQFYYAFIYYYFIFFVRQNVKLGKNDDKGRAFSLCLFYLHIFFLIENLRSERREPNTFYFCCCRHAGKGRCIPNWFVFFFFVNLKIHNLIEWKQHSKCIPLCFQKQAIH